MTNKQYQELLQGMFDDIMAITAKKAHDYAQDGDTLSNFKIQAAIRNALRGTNIKSSDVDFDFILTKLARLANLMNKGAMPANEPIRDSIMDGINYLGLLYACLIEEKGEKTGE